MCPSYVPAASRPYRSLHLQQDQQEWRQGGGGPLNAALRDIFQ